MNEAGRILQDITASNFKVRQHPDKVRIFNDFAHHEKEFFKEKMCADRDSSNYEGSGFLR